MELLDRHLTGKKSPGKVRIHRTSSEEPGIDQQEEIKERIVGDGLEGALALSETIDEDGERKKGAC